MTAPQALFTSLHAKPCRVQALCLCYPRLVLRWELASYPLVTRFPLTASCVGF